MSAELVFYNSQDVIAEYDTYWAEGYRAWGQLYPIMSQDLRFYLGDQWTAEEKQYLEDQNRHAYVFNKAKSKIDWLLGYQIQNRLSSVCVPVLDIAQQTCDQYTKLMLNILTQAGGYREITNTFSSGLKTGWGLCNLYMDYNTDPLNGDFCFATDPYSAFMLDPYFTKRDLSDCNWVMKRKYLSPLQAEVLLPGQEEDVRLLAHDGWERDNKFTWMVFQRIPTGQRMMAYTEFYRLKYESQKILVNDQTKQFVDWNEDPDTYIYLKRLAEQQGANLEVMYRKKQFIEKHIILNNTYMRTEINPYGLNEYPFAFYAPIFESQSEEYTFKVQSMIRLLKDSQRETNRRRSQIIDIVESNLNTGYIEVDGAVKNPHMLYQTGQGKRIVLNKGYGIDSIQKIAPAVVPPNFFEETAQAERDMMDILGLNETSFGTQDSKQVSALVEMHRQAAGLTAQQDIFDSLRDMQRDICRKMIKMFQKWSPAKIKMMIGEEPTEEFFDATFAKFDVVVQEGVLTDTQRYMHFRQLIDLKQLGEPIPPGYLTKIAPLQGKTELFEAMEAYQKQMDEQQQALQQSEQAESQALSQAAQAKAISDLALSKERQTRAIANLGLEDERVAKAQEDRQAGMLETVRAMHELEKLNTEIKSDKDKRTSDLLQFFQTYQQFLQGKEQEEKADNEAQVNRTGPQPSSASPSSVS